MTTLAHQHRSALRDMRRQLLDMAAEWDGVDEARMLQLIALAAQCDDAAVQMVPDEDCHA